MKHLVLIILSFLFISKNVQSQLPIDVLYEKYKDKNSVTLYTSYSDLVGNVYIKKNIDGKPQAIVIEGSTSDFDALEEFMEKMEKTKKSDGFNNESSSSTNGIIIHSADGHISNLEVQNAEHPMSFIKKYKTLYKKGNQYYTATAYYEREKIDIIKYNTKYYITYHFTIESGDYSRKGGSQSSDFDF